MADSRAGVAGGMAGADKAPNEWASLVVRCLQLEAGASGL